MPGCSLDLMPDGINIPITVIIQTSNQWQEQSQLLTFPTDSEAYLKEPFHPHRSCSLELSQAVLIKREFDVSAVSQPVSCWERISGDGAVSFIHPPTAAQTLGTRPGVSPTSGPPLKPFTGLRSMCEMKILLRACNLKASLPFVWLQDLPRTAWTEGF